MRHLFRNMHPSTTIYYIYISFSFTLLYIITVLFLHSTYYLTTKTEQKLILEYLNY